MKKTQFFMLGIITALGALFLELLFFTVFNLKMDLSRVYSHSFVLAVILSVFLEESLKISVLFKILKKIIREESGQKPVFLSAVMAGLGFSATEIFLNLFNLQTNRYFFFLDIFGLLIVHIGTFAILGYVLAKKADFSFPKFALFLPVTISFHLLYNILVIYRENSGFYFLFLILSLILILVFSRDLKKPLKNENLPKSEISL